MKGRGFLGLTPSKPFTFTWDFGFYVLEIKLEFEEVFSNVSNDGIGIWTKISLCFFLYYYFFFFFPSGVVFLWCGVVSLLDGGDWLALATDFDVTEKVRTSV